MHPNSMTRTRAAPSSSAPDASECFNSAEIRLARRQAFAVAGFASALFVLGAYLYAQSGGPWVDSLDERLGEVLAQRAAGALLAEHTEEAYTLYEEALKAGFQDRDQAVWVRQDYAAALTDGGRLHRALQLAIEIVELRVGDISDWVGRRAFSRLQAAYAGAGDNEGALAAASAWSEAGLRAENRSVQAQAKYYRGLSLQALGRLEEASTDFVAAYALSPTPQIAQAAADALTQLGRDDDARRYLTSGAP
jgi:tetratricopeptide (TPR) repeat protein